MIKKFILIAIVAFSFTECTQAGNKEASKTASVANVQHINRAEFLTKVFNYEKETKEVKYLGEKPSIIDFYANWCGPCRQLSPLLEELAGEYKGKLVVYKIDTDQEKQLSQDLGIQALPTLIFFPKKGKPIMLQGYRPKEELKKIIDEQLLN